MYLKPDDDKSTQLCLFLLTNVEKRDKKFYKNKQHNKIEFDTNSHVEANMGFVPLNSPQSSCIVQLAHHGVGVGKDLDERIDFLSFV
jgi:hypothetical protein